MNMRIAVVVCLVIAGLSLCGSVVAQQAGFKAATMWPSVANANATSIFSAAILAVNPAGDLQLLSDQMPDTASFGVLQTLGEEPYRISSSVIETTFEKTFTVIFDTSDGTPFIGVNAYPGPGGGPTNQLCFEVGNSLSGDVPMELWDIPFSIIETYVATYNDSGTLLLDIHDVPYMILVDDTSTSLNICYYNLAGAAIGPQRPAKLKMVFTISNDVIFRNGFE